MRKWTLLCCVLVSVFAGCTSTAPTVIYTGSVTDPQGDVITQGGAVPVPADMISAKLDVVGTDLVITVTFAPGTLSHADSQWQVNLDTDDNPATGVIDEPTIGIDFIVRAVFPRGSTTAEIVKVVNNTFPVVGTATVSYPTNDSAKVTVPLSKLGDDEGKLSFKFTTAHWLNDTGGSSVLDTMPNVGLPVGTVR